MNIPSILRIAEHQALSTLTLDKNVLDLGGEKNSEYLSYIKGTFNVTSVNNDPHAHPDIMHDLEQVLRIAQESYNHVLLINVLEHIFNYKQLIAEATRVVKPGGKVVIIVPFLFPIHRSPHDYRRFTDETLQGELALVGLQNITTTPLGSGIFAARHLMLSRLLPLPLRMVNHYITRHIVTFEDYVWQKFAHMIGKQYKKSDYPLGYLAVGQKAYGAKKD